jgi:cob(I)alamin adenosyltransferase
MILRCIAHEMTCAVVQFIKGAWDTGERRIIEANFSDLCEFHAMGEGFTWETQDRERDVATAEKGWQKAVSLMRDPSFDMVILDELNIATRYHYVAIERIVEELSRKREMLHVVITGRNASPELIELADLGSEMKGIKHPYGRGIKPQRGVEF